MTVFARPPFSPWCRLALIGAMTGAALIVTATASRAQSAPTIVGSLANFDVVNDTEGEKEGFEIQLEGLEPGDIIRVFGQSGAQCYIRYCIGSITPYGTPGVAPFGVYVRWTANYDPVTGTFTTPASAPGNRHGTPSRIGNVHALPITGESCWSLGAGAAYAESGCEHFGVSTTAGRFPTAVKTVTYRWLVPDATSPGSLVPPPDTIVPPVAIAHPVAQGEVLAGVPDVQVVAPAARPVAPAHRYGKAQWVKVYKTELDRHADLDELVGGHPNDVVPNAENQIGGTETEWKLLQLDVRNPDKGGSRLVSHGSPGNGKHAVVRRYEFYKYAGAVVPPGGTSGGGKGGGAVLSTDDQEASLLCTRSVPGDLTTECVAPGPGEVGDFIGAQMAAENLGNLITPIITWPTPGPTVYGTALSDAQLNATAVGVGGTFTYTPAPGTVLPAGTHTLQAVFTPFDATRFGTQSMTMSISVDRAPLTVVADHLSKVYGAPDPALSFTASGLQNGDTVAAALTGALALSPGADVGARAIGLGTLAATGNYTLTFTGSTLDITAAPLTIAAGDDSKIYGATLALTPTAFSTHGLIGTDTVDSVSLASVGAAAPASVGSYDIVPSGAVGSGLANYTIDYVNGALTVTPAPLTVLADPQKKDAGTPDPPLTFLASGFQSADTAAILTGALTREPGDSPGNYAIGQGTLSAGANYTIAFTGNTLVVVAPPPPPPTGMAIAPIPPQFSTDGDEVELQVVILRPPALRGSRTERGGDDDRMRDPRGVFSIDGLNGLRIDDDGEIRGRIRAGVSVETVFKVTVRFTAGGSTATQTITWTVRPAPRAGRDKEHRGSDGGAG